MSSALSVTLVKYSCSAVNVLNMSSVIQTAESDLGSTCALSAEQLWKLLITACQLLVRCQQFASDSYVASILQCKLYHCSIQRCR